MSTAKVTPFQQRVYAAICLIPPGRVTTYKILGDHLNCRGYRAVGQALRRNPFAPNVPCHRVVTSDLRAGGFAGSRAGDEIARKRRLLVNEGVLFQGDRIADPGCVFHFAPVDETESNHAS